MPLSDYVQDEPYTLKGHLVPQWHGCQGAVLFELARTHF